MAALSLDAFLEYLRDLGERHPDVKTSLVSLLEHIPSLDVAQYPCVLVEPDPLATELSPAQDEWQCALFVLVRPERSDDKPDPALVTIAKAIADSIRQQLEDEHIVCLRGKPDFVLLYNNADSAKSSGVRMGLTLLVEKMPDRNANRASFAPRIQFPYQLPTNGTTA